jgi:uncharacterized protein (TIGR03083 family)
MGTLEPRAVDHVAAIEREARDLVAAATGNLAAPVVRYPGWSVLDLLTHTGGVHRWVTELVEGRATERPARRSYTDLVRADQAPQWFRDGVAALVTTLDRADPTQPLWTLVGGGTVGFWRRRMAHETAIHRRDAEDARGPGRPIDADLAVGAIDETLDIYVARRLSGQDLGGLGERVILRADDAGADWELVLLPSDVRAERVTGQPDRGRAGLVLRGSASDLWLYLMGRLPIAALDVTGDAAVGRQLDRLLARVEDARP